MSTSLAATILSMLRRANIRTVDDFIAVLLSAPGFLAEYMQSPAAIAAAELHVEQAAAEQAAHVEEVLRFQMEIRTLAVDIGIQEQIVAGLISTADRAAEDRAAADNSAGCAKAERAAAARTLEEAKSLQVDAKQAAAEAQAERKRAAKERTAAEAARVKLAKEEHTAAHAARERERAAAASAEQRERDATAVSTLACS